MPTESETYYEIFAINMFLTNLTLDTISFVIEFTEKTKKNVIYNYALSRSS